MSTHISGPMDLCGPTANRHWFALINLNNYSTDRDNNGANSITLVSDTSTIVVVATTASLTTTAAAAANTSFDTVGGR